MIEYLRGNPKYLKYFSNSELITSIMNLIELYFLVLREHDEEIADNAYAVFRHYQREIDEGDVREGMKLRLKMMIAKINLSYADSIGYVISKRLGTKYLTGDKAFRTLTNVEFVR